MGVSPVQFMVVDVADAHIHEYIYWAVNSELMKRFWEDAVTDRVRPTDFDVSLSSAYRISGWVLFEIQTKQQVYKSLEPMVKRLSQPRR